MAELSSLICAVVTESTTAACRAAIAEAATAADIIELRLDYLRDFDFTDPGNLTPLLEAKPLPVIITCRAVSEGGQQQVDDTVRLRLMVEGARGMADFCDIEAEFYSEAARLSPDPSRLIVSYHNFLETSDDLLAIYDRLITLPARIHKIVTRANRISDSLAIFNLLERAGKDNRRMIAIAMEQPGFITRVLGLSRGCFLTYGSLGSGRESAPGQLRCDELRGVYRVKELSRNTKVTGIIGSPVSHSVSPEMHNAAFKALGLDFVYLPFEVDDVTEFFTRFVKPSTRELDWELRGFSVTIPHKTAVAPFLDEVDGTARKIGAVNTVVLSDGKIKGYNSDAGGFLEPLAALLTIKGEKCAIVGAGGAARAVAYALAEQGARITLYVRDVARAIGMAEEFGINVEPLAKLQSSNDVIVINTTQVGMRGHSEGDSPIPREWLRNRRIAYDLVYNPIDTLFLRDARSEGCQTISGIEMLVAQAGVQFELWTGRKAPRDLMREAALASLAGYHANPPRHEGTKPHEER